MTTECVTQAGFPEGIAPGSTLTGGRPVCLSTRSISLFPAGIHNVDTTSGKGLSIHRIKGASGMHCVQEGADLWEKRLFLTQVGEKQAASITKTKRACT